MHASIHSRQLSPCISPGHACRRRSAAATQLRARPQLPVGARPWSLPYQQQVQQQQQQLVCSSQRGGAEALPSASSASGSSAQAAAHGTDSAQLVEQQQQHQQPHPVADPQQQQQPPQRRGPLRWLRRSVGRLPLFVRAAEGAPAWRLPARALLQALRYCATALALGALLLVGRGSLARAARSAPREVLYSEFVGLVDQGRVRAARLESSTSKLYFELQPGAAAAADGSAPAAAAAATTAAAKGAGSGAGKGSQAGRSSAGSGQAAAAATGAATAAATGAATGAAVAAAPGSSGSIARRFFVKLADKQDPFLVSKVLTAGVEYGVVRASFQQQLQHMLLTVLALWVPLLPLLFFAFRAMESRSGMRKRNKSSAAAATPAITFADVAGVTGAKEELREVVACLRSAQQYARLGAKMPSGVLLAGPPGTGKTLLAKAVAGEAGVPFMAVSASEFVELFVGRGAARVRELFAEARKLAPCVIFIDELDAIGSKRGTGFNDERDQTLNQLLTELDGFEGRQGVMLLAATNRAEALDPALLRPGRISRRVTVPLPDEAGRAAILGVHLRAVELDVANAGSKADVARQLAALTPGFSGAELANLVNEALLLTARRGKEEVELTELLEGLTRTKYGVDGGRGGSQAGGPLGRRLARWLTTMQRQQTASQAVKVGAA